MAKSRSQAILEYMVSKGITFGQPEKEVLRVITAALRVTAPAPTKQETQSTKTESTETESISSTSEIEKPRDYSKALFVLKKGYLVRLLRSGTKPFYLDGALQYSDFFRGKPTQYDDSRGYHPFCTFRTFSLGADSDAELLELLDDMLSPSRRVFWLKGSYHSALYWFDEGGNFVEVPYRFKKLIDGIRRTDSKR